MSVAGTHLALGLSTSRDNAWISIIPLAPAASQTSPSMVLPLSCVTSRLADCNLLDLGKHPSPVAKSVCAALQTSWKEDVLTGSFHPATPKSQAASSAQQKSSLLQQLYWLPDGSAVMAVDRLGNLGAVNSNGTVQRVSIEVIALCIFVASYNLICVWAVKGVSNL